LVGCNEECAELFAADRFGVVVKLMVESFCEL